MADWKKLSKDLLLADGVIDEDETKLLKKEILEDGIVDDEEVGFLVELRDSAESTSKQFEELFFSALKTNILADGVVDADEVKRLRKIIFADGKVDENEKQFLQELKKEAKETDPEFDILLNECMQ